MRASEDTKVVVGRVSGLFGVKGWVKLFSYTEPRENVVAYRRWYLSQHGVTREVEVREGRRHGKTVIALLNGFDDREQAAEIVGAEISIDRDQLAPCDDGEYYWADLIGLEVVTAGGEALGQVDHLIETGANDVLVVRGGANEYLVPFARPEVIKRVDIAGGTIEVDWSVDF